MSELMSPNLPAGLLAAAALLALPVTARAVSDGDYSYQQQGCSGGADQYNKPGAEQGCHNLRVAVTDGAGNPLLTAGTGQTASGRPVSSADYSFTPAAADPGSGARVYFGADDNLDTGEHDGSPQWQDGPSDGGGIHADATPALIYAWLGAVMTGDTPYLLTHPTPIDAGYGACADGTCLSVQTSRRTAFQGGSGGARDAADYTGMRWDPATCSSSDQQSQTPAACGGHQLSWWNQNQGTVYVEPGAQVYEDPDAQASPALPLYPIPSAYAGTCGVVAGGGQVAAPSSPLTNSAGQVDLSTGC